MSRPLRIEFAGALYHVMNRGAARKNTFVDEQDYEAFLDTLGQAHRLWRIDVLAYALMGNHYHLCLRTPKGNLSRVMRHVDGVYTQRFNRRHKRDGSLFRGRYQAILVDEDEYLLQVVRYIHLNPVEAGIVGRPEQYRWSGVAGHYRVPEEEVLRGVRGKENEARKVAMCLVRRCCEQRLGETARLFGLRSYGAVGWAWHAVRVRMERERKFRDRVEALAAEFCQQKI